ncbi:radical SAM protein [Collinsella sp. zg1085]|uniref:radical SAM protein n=1 Tax=Collinsella sp. zg1085 TaxID=2844380 RepID=UPI001C0D3772|nr:radical SAM protein [Collinsella sp. zg1085]QWT17975.1 radical SAM protein [Collinsella sp. zg1085]
MHFTDTVYRNPYWPTYPLLQITQGCTHNRCKFCTMYHNVKFRMQPMEWIEEDLQELAQQVPEAKTIQLLSADPLVLSYDKLAPVLEKINHYLPHMEQIYTQGRVSDLKNKTVEQLKNLKDMGMREVSLGVESGDDRTLKRIKKGYTSQDIIEQCAKLSEAGIDFWMTFLNGVAGKEGSKEHALKSAEIFSQCKPMLVGTGALVLFPGTPLLKDIERGEFTPLSEKEMLEELLLFVEHLHCDCNFITHHTVSGANLTGPDFLKRKKRIIQALRAEIKHGNMAQYAAIRSYKQSL